MFLMYYVKKSTTVPLSVVGVDGVVGGGEVVVGFGVINSKTKK